MYSLPSRALLSASTAGATDLGILTPPPLVRFNELLARGAGLGSVKKDPRFMPGPALAPNLPCGIDGAPNTHAGGPTFAPLLSSTFMAPNTWQSRYQDKLGRGTDAILTNSE
jgi:hypothetical protein